MAVSVARPNWATKIEVRRPRHVLLWIFTGIIALFTLTPVLMLIIGSFSGVRLPSDFSLERLTLSNYINVYSDPRTYRVMMNTAIYTVGSLFFGLSMAIFFAWLLARTDLPLKWVGYIGIPLTMVIPGMLESMSWVLLFSPRIGFVNRFFTDTLGAAQPLFDVYSMAGMVIIQSLSVVPTALLMLLPLFLKFDPALEEAGAMSGGRMAAVTRRITLPLLIPGIMAVGVYQLVSVLSSFEIPGIIGLPGQIYVFSTLIYSWTSSSAAMGGSDYGSANALGMVYVAVCIVGLWAYLRVTRNAGSFAVITGKGYRPRLIELGPLRWVAFSLVAAYVFITFFMPLMVLSWVSVTPLLLQPTAESLSRVTLKHWVALWTNQNLIQTVGNTALMTIVTSTLVVAICLAIGWISIRTKFSGKGVLDQLTFVSHGVPSIIMALALIWLWVQVDVIPLYGTLWIIVIGLTIGFLAYGVRTMSAALLQIHTDLEEAAYTSGATMWTTIRRVFVPLLAPAMAGLWIWVALHAVRYITIPLMLETGPHNRVLGAYLWRQWDNGEANLVAAVGLSLVIVMLLVTLIVAQLGLGSRRGTLNG